jgi:hypothetical protein
MINNKILGIITVFIVVAAIQGVGLITSSLAHVGSITLFTPITASHGGNNEGAGGGPGNYGSANPPLHYLAPPLTPQP